MAITVKTYWDTSQIRNGHTPCSNIEFSDGANTFFGSCSYSDGFLILDELDSENTTIKEFFKVLCDCFENKCNLNNLNDAIKNIFGPEASVDTICIHVCKIPVMFSYAHHDFNSIYLWYKMLLTSFGSHKKAN